MSESRKGNEPPTFDQAISTIRQWHYDAIRSIVDDAIEACVGKVRCKDPDAETVARDAEKEGKQHLADEIRGTHATERYNRERDEGTDPHEFLTEYIDQATDDHNHVIYTFKAKCVLLASDNEDAYQDEMGEPAPTVEAAACMAMRRDCWELLEARDDEWKPRDCEDCCTTLDVSIVDSVSDDHDESCSLHPDHGKEMEDLDPGRTDVITALSKDA